jgi:hypothetical protein
VTFLRLLVLAAVTLSGVFGEAGARTVSLETDTFVVDLYVDVAESTGSVVAHLSTGVDDTRVIALQHRGGGRWGIRTELPRKNYMVVFEVVGPGQLSDPVTLTQLGASLDLPGEEPAEEPGPEREPSASSRWGWLALALGAASLSALAFWVLGGEDDDGEAGEEE